MNLPLDQNIPYVIEYPFLNEKESFLKKGVDLLTNFSGEPLDELIALDSNEFDGMVLDRKNIPIITNYIYNNLLSKKHPKLRIKNGKLNLFVYTLSKIDDIVLFHVWQIVSQESDESRNAWEKKYRISPGACCENNYFQCQKENFRNFASLLEEEDLSKSEKLIDTLKEKLCKYKTPHIQCLSLVHSHFFNHDNQKAVEYFLKSRFNIPIAKNFQFRLNGLLKPVFFCFNSTEYPGSIRCTDFYDALIFENTPKNTIEKNFQNFLSDSLFTCYSFQNKISNKYPISNKNKQHRLLYISLYFDL